MTVELRAINSLPGADRFRFSIDGPAPGEQRDGEAIELDGWIVGLDQPVVAVRLLADGAERSRIPVARERADVGAAHPGQPWSEMSGFRGWAPLAGLSDRFTLSLAAETGDGAVTPFAAAVLSRAEEDWSNLPAASDWGGPDFIVIGAQRAGSTSLYRYLTAHPGIAPARIKELHYFSHHHQRPWAWYRDQFPRNLPAGMLTGEATPYYLYHPLAPERIARTSPAAKLIAVLRNPVDRALSHYHHERARGTEWLDFEASLAAEPERLSGERNRMISDPDYTSLVHQNASYVDRGRYADQLRQWYAIIPRDRILVVRSEDLYCDPVGATRKVTDFLGLPSFDLPDQSAHNERHYPDMAPATRQALQQLFREPNRDLAALIGRDMEWDDVAGFGKDNT